MERICPICRETISIYSCVILGRCGHFLCQICWDNFKDSHLETNTRTPPKCPSCRSLIHISSVIQKENVRYIRETMEQDLRNENSDLRNQLIELSDFSRKKIGIWKHAFKVYLNKCHSIGYEEQRKRKHIEQDYLIDTVLYQEAITSFLDSLKQMRFSLRMMTKGYQSPPRPKYPMPPDPVDIIPPELLEEIRNSTQPLNTRTISNIPLPQGWVPGPPFTVLDDVRQILTHTQNILPIATSSSQPTSFL